MSQNSRCRLDLDMPESGEMMRKMRTNASSSKDTSSRSSTLSVARFLYNKKPKNTGTPIGISTTSTMAMLRTSRYSELRQSIEVSYTCHDSPKSSSRHANIVKTVDDTVGYARKMISIQSSLAAASGCFLLAVVAASCSVASIFSSVLLGSSAGCTLDALQCATRASSCTSRMRATGRLTMKKKRVYRLTGAMHPTLNADRTSRFTTDSVFITAWK